MERIFTIAHYVFPAMINFHIKRKRKPVKPPTVQELEEKDHKRIIHLFKRNSRRGKRAPK
jgi:hypothetical protein